MRGARWVATGLLDQAVIAAANAGLTLLALAVVSPRGRAGDLLLSLSLGYLVLGLNREFVGNVMLAQVSRLGGAERARMVRDGAAAAFGVGCLAALALLGMWAFWRHPVNDVSLGDLVWLAPLLPAVLVHDTGRAVYLSEREPGRALRIDLIWVGTQAALVLLGVAAHRLAPGLLPLSWGIGAVAGAATFLVHTRTAIWRGDPRRWLHETRHLSGWFTATGVVGQLQVQAVGWVVAGQLSRGDLAGLRAGQTTLLQPVQNFVTAMMGLLVPRASRLAADRDESGLRRQTLRVAAGFAGLAVVLVAVAVPVGQLVLRHIPKYADIAGLVLPISVQAGIYLVQIPFAAAIRGMQRGRLLFTQYSIFTVTSLTGLVTGAATGRLGAAAWGLTIGAAVGLVVFVALYAWAVAKLGPGSPDPAADAPASRNASPASR
jgi:O-antigen/teichoic acid export membrane protein